ncbi:Maleamate amidohydrolase (plasmid) [Variovorax sp. WDL1]|nr:N-carbamoylsarcosine amidase [Variovorax sp. WDL1]PNG50603.1 Maleamate amidohydrolase [Variovorax sp. B2]PNG51472.1 Maleamate amidohydrolase [Variovorax sp. B4]VTV17787.1 Maleamate amidohydrolase [Variovorax sp. WDL1]
MPDGDIYSKQGFGTALQPAAPFGLLIVDFVNAFADPAQFGGGNIAQAIDGTKTLLARARQKKWPIVHTRIVFDDAAADANVFAMKVPGVLKLNESCRESQIVSALTPEPGELVVRKTVPSAFFGTSLAPWLAQRGVRSLLVAGATTSGCVRASVVDAMSWGYRPIVVPECVGDRSIDAHNASLFDMNQKYAALMPATEALLLS